MNPGDFLFPGAVGPMHGKNEFAQFDAIWDDLPQRELQGKNDRNVQN